MPLELDGLPRGRYALHVYPHGKLGRHMTLINEALPLVNTLIDRKDVKVVDLGRIVLAKGGRDWQRIGVQCTQRGRELHLVCIAPKAMQFITTTFLVGVDLQTLSEEIQRQGFGALSK